MHLLINGVAAEGKVLRRKSSGETYGREIYLGYSHYIGGVRQIPSHKDMPEDFEEVDDHEDITDPEALHLQSG